MHYGRTVIVSLMLLNSVAFAQTQCNSTVPQLEQGTLFRYNTYTPQQIIEQLEQIRRDGFNQISSGTRPRELKPHMDSMRKQLDWCDANGMKLWLLYPIQFGDQPDMDKWFENPASVKQYVNLFEDIFKGHQCIAGIILGNEVNIYEVLKQLDQWKNWPHFLAGFQQYVIQKHGNLQAVNAAWGTAFESVNAICPVELDYSKVPMNPKVTKDQEVYRRNAWLAYCSSTSPGYIDAQRFVMQQFDRYYTKLIDEVFRPLFGDKVLYCSKISGGTTDPYEQRAVRGYTACSWDHSMAKYPPFAVQILVDTVQTPLGRPVYDSEAHLYHDKHDYRGTPHSIAYVLYRETLLGQMKHTSYNWGKQESTASREKHAAAIKAMAVIRENLPVFQAFVHTRAQATVGVLVTEQNRYWNIAPLYVSNRPPSGDAVVAYAHMAALGRPWRYVMDMDLNTPQQGGVQTLVVASRWLTRQTLTQLLAMPRDCRLIVVGDWPVNNEYAQPHPESLISAFKQRAVQVSSWMQLTQAIKPAEQLPAAYQQTTNEQAWEKWSRWDSAYPYTLPGPMLEVRQVHVDGVQYIAVMNHNADKALTAPIPWVDGKMVTQLVPPQNESRINTTAYTFEPQTVTIFKCR